MNVAALSIPAPIRRSESVSKGGVVNGLSFNQRASPIGNDATVFSSAHLCLSCPVLSRTGKDRHGQRGIKFLFVYFFAFIFLITACAPTATPAAETQIINVYTTPAAQPWLANVFACTPFGTVINVVSNPASADISLRIGEPELLTASAYQFDTEEILVVTPRQSPVQNLTLEGARELFAGQGDPSVQVWVYAAGEDVQMVFEQAVMQGRSVTSSARLATGPQQMSDVLNNMPNTVGILPRHWKVGDSRFVYTIPDVPVLALTDEESQGVIQAVIACLQ
jgi:hypothetical protein